LRVHVGVGVYEPWRDDLALGVKDLLGAIGNLANGGNFPVGDGHVRTETRHA
jgi:hypothetical protein